MNNEAFREKAEEMTMAGFPEHDGNRESDRFTATDADIAMTETPMEESSYEDVETWDGEENWDVIEESFAEDLQEFAEDHFENLPIVAVVGRPNVGKSTLVNRVIGRRQAVVEDVPGVTRDRVSYDADWNGRRFMVTDTGGWESDAKGMAGIIAQQAEIAIRNADVIMFVVDSTVGITAEDELIGRILHRAEAPVVLVANKVDSPKLEADTAEFWSLGLDHPYPVSSLHGRGTGDVLDRIVSLLPDVPRMGHRQEHGPRRIALVGKPNVGKSSLLNKLSGDERSVVDNVAGTTVDPVDSLVSMGEKTWQLVDTAGLRKRVGTATGHEYYASLRTMSAIESAEVVIMLIDASEPITEQDQRILTMVIETGRALVIAFNKWDLVDEDRRYVLEKEIDRDLARVPWAQRVNISALTGRALQRLEPAVERALESWDKRVPTGRLNAWLKDVVAATPPPMRGGRLPRIQFVTQAATRPPTFVFFTTRFLEAGYRRFLERKLRETFNFDGSPVRVNVRVKEKRTIKK